MEQNILNDSIKANIKTLKAILETAIKDTDDAINSLNDNDSQSINGAIGAIIGFDKQLADAIAIQQATLAMQRIRLGHNK